MVERQDGGSEAAVSIVDVTAAAAWFAGHLAPLSPTDLQCPSALPGWSRAHVVAHVILNAEAFVVVAAALNRRNPGYMYPGASTAREAEISELAIWPITRLLDRLENANNAFTRSWDPEPPEGQCATSPNHPWFDSSTVLLRRLRELQVHGVDLALESASVSSWSRAFVDADLPLQWTTVSHRTDESVRVVDDLGKEWVAGNQRPESAPIEATRQQLLGWILDRFGLKGSPTLKPWASRSRWEHLQAR